MSRNYVTIDSKTDLPSIGIIGAGALGTAIAQRLVAAGYVVRGYRRGTMEAFVAVGGISAPSAADVASISDLLILLLPNDEALTSVMEEIAATLRFGQVLICMATHPLGVKQDAAAVAASVGAILLDGEVSGTPEMLRAGQASVVIAGDSIAVERVRLALAAFASEVNVLPTFGDAYHTKLITNYLMSAHVVAAAEALALGQRLGLDPAMLLNSLASSAGGSRMLAVRGPMMTEGRFREGNLGGFLHYFDLLRAAIPNGAASHAPLLAVTEDLYRRTVAEGGGNRDLAIVYNTIDALIG